MDDKSVDVRARSLEEVHRSVQVPDGRWWRRILAFSGPAYMVSVGYMDPGNWATDIAGGSAFGYQLIWVLLMSNLMALLLQSLSARLGIVRGLDYYNLTVFEWVTDRLGAQGTVCAGGRYDGLVEQLGADLGQADGFDGVVDGFGHDVSPVVEW